MNELILLLFLIFVVLPIAALIVIIKFIIWIVRKIKGSSGESAEETFREKKPVRKFSGSEIMFIIGTVFIVLSGIAFGCAGWVNTSPAGRVFIMLAVSGVMYGAGVVFRKFLKLDGTASAFGVIGIILLAVTNITAGYYELFGEWLSVDGDGCCMLYALSALIVAGAAFAQSKLSDITAFKYLSCMSLTATVIFLAGQISDGYDTFAIIMVLLQTFMAVWLVFGTIFNEVIKKSAGMSMVIFSILALIWAVDKTVVPDGTAYFIVFVTLIQLIGYGIYLKSSVLKGLQSVVSVWVTFMLCSEAKTDDTEIMIFSGIMLAVYSANRFIPCLRNKFSELLTLGFAVWSAVFAATLDDNTALAIPVILSGLIMSYAFSKSKTAQVISGLASPILPFIIALLRSSYTAFNIFAVSMCLSTILLMRFFPKKNSRTVLYANMLAAGISLMLMAFDIPQNIFLLMMICFFHTAVSCLMPNNWTGMFSVGGFTAVAVQLEISNYKMFAVFCGMMILARIFFKDKLIKKSECTTKCDIIMPSALLVFTYFEGNIFLALMTAAVFFANLVRRKTNRTFANWVLSISSFLTMLAMLNRPFLLPDSEIIDSKITLAIITLMGAAYRYIWKNSPKVSKFLSETIFILAFAGLVWDIMDYSQAMNTIFGLAVIAVVLVISFTAKNLKWFRISSLAIVVITLWAGTTYFERLEWWAYLFIAGILFIAVAAVNEYFKKNGKKLSDIFADWK
ncbi:MAG: hypothetical protein K2J40_05705 [Ruminococcus sp.]|nr:hypothetical protein [Ruminococcus sp.]